MSGFLKQLAARRSSLLESSENLEKYYQKISSATKYRFHNRLELSRIIRYPPTIDGNEDYRESAKYEQNEFIRKLLFLKPHPETAVFPGEYALSGPPKGRIYEKFPFKFRVEKDAEYMFCTCGHSKKQPFCDDSHKILWGTHLEKRVPKYRPIKYIATETKDVWFCNCKQSSKLPLCDGTHKLDEVQKENSVK